MWAKKYFPTPENKTWIRILLCRLHHVEGMVEYAAGEEV